MSDIEDCEKKVTMWLDEILEASMMGDFDKVVMLSHKIHTLAQEDFKLVGEKN